METVGEIKVGKIEKLFEKRKKSMSECKETVMVYFRDLGEELFLKVLERVKGNEERIRSIVNPLMRQSTFGGKEKSGGSPKKKMKVNSGD